MAAPATTTVPAWVKLFTQSADPPRPAARAIREVQDILPYSDGVHRPYIHLVDGGVSDNLGMRGVLDALEFLEALHDKGLPTPLDQARRIIVFVVNSLSSPPTNWDESENPPGTVDILLKATGAPIDHYSFEAVELLKDIAARWRTARETPERWPGVRPTRTRRSAPRYVLRKRRSMPSMCRLPGSPTRRSAIS